MEALTSKRKVIEQYMNAPIIHAPQWPRNYEQIRQRAQAIYAARGGMMGMTLNDWLKAEQELKQEFGLQTNKTDNQGRNYENDEL